MDLTVELASLYMLLWDEKFRFKCDKLGIDLDLYTRYVDDSLQITGEIEKGWKYCSNRKKMVNDGIGPFDDLPDDQRTFKILESIANDIDDSIVMVMDVPSLHDNGRLPVLDIEVWMDDKSKCIYSFFSKPIANPFIILYDSAVPISIKRTTILQEGIRRYKILLVWLIKMR